MITIHSINGWSQVIRGVEFNCLAAIQVAHQSYCSFYQCHLANERLSGPLGVWLEAILHPCWFSALHARVLTINLNPLLLLLIMIIIIIKLTAQSLYIHEKLCLLSSFLSNYSS